MTTKTSRPDQSKGLEPFARWQITTALSLMLIFSTTLTAWSMLAPLSSAVVAPGIVTLENQRKTVQHLEGGIIGRILVREGSRVSRDEVLIELRDVTIKSTVDRLKSQYYEALAGAARLAAERDGLPDIAFPEVLGSAAMEDSVARSAIAAQRKIFESRGELMRQKQSVLDKRIDRLQEERVSLKRQLEALQRQIALSEQESKDAAILLDKQLLRKSRMTEIQRNRAGLDERRSSLEGALAQAEQQTAELQLRKSELESSALTSVVEEIRSRQARAHELSRELAAAQDMLNRTRIRAPTDGIVVGLQVHSRDGVVAPGQTLMEIVPATDTLVVDARVRPEDIEDVRAGLDADIVLNTLSRRFNQSITGRLSNVSADRLIDKLTGRPFYLARVSVDAGSVEKADAKMLAGMSADVFIKTGDRTPLSYLVAPITRTLSRGMRER